MPGRGTLESAQNATEGDKQDADGWLGRRGDDAT